MSLTILIVDDEDNARMNMSDFLSTKGYDVIDTASLVEAKQIISRGQGDVVLLDVRLPDGYGPNLLHETAHLPNRPPIILITAYGDIEMAVEAMKNGAHDFISKPIEFDRLEQSIQRAAETVQMKRELAMYRMSQQKPGKFVVGENEEFQKLLTQAEKASSASVSVLITGETGTGKEVMARYLHQIGPRSQKPFVAINCAAIQSTVLESELFGFEPGAYTSADRRKLGLMEIADAGVLFLDEISSMPLEVQAKLLRALEERAFRRVGGTKLINVDVQILAASNRDLKKMIQDEKFREDLYYRLKVVDLHIPPLRERRNDIPALVGFFIRNNNSRLGMNVVDIAPMAMAALKQYAWPGNIRELSNTVERAMLFCDGEKIDIANLPDEIVKVAK